MAAFTLTTGITSCKTMDQIGGALGLENKVRVPARVVACQSPTVTRYSGAGTIKDTRIRASGVIIEQEVTVQRLDDKRILSGSILLDSVNDRVWRGNTGFVLIGVTSGRIRGFEVTAD